MIIVVVADGVASAGIIVGTADAVVVVATAPVGRKAAHCGSATMRNYAHPMRITIPQDLVHGWTRFM